VNLRSLALVLVITAAGAALAGCDKAGAQQAPTPAPPASGAPATGRVVAITAGDEGFVPAIIPAAKGEELVLRFTRTTESDCLKAIELPALGIKKDLPVKVAVDVPVRADKEGSIDFQCWMKMYKGKVVVK
jgi:plastocyanin domain-containing protein